VKTQHPRLRLKQPTGWFPAGQPFLQALTLLSDGAFKLFAYLCLNADRLSACYVTSHQRLALALNKSRHTIEAYLAELQQKEICSVRPSRIPYLGSSFRICDPYWPYSAAEGSDSGQPLSNADRYVAGLRESFLALGCSSGRFAPSDEKMARELHRQGVPLEVIQNALILGACRKYLSWLNSGPSDPIATLRYFQPLIEEVQQRPFPPGYGDHLRCELKKLTRLWHQQTDTHPKGYADKASPAIPP
jgi:hypothetical protein